MERLATQRPQVVQILAAEQSGPIRRLRWKAANRAPDRLGAGVGSIGRRDVSHSRS